MAIDISLQLQGLKVSTVPEIEIAVDGIRHSRMRIDGRHVVTLQFDLLPGDHRLSLKFLNKNYSETSTECDMAVIIEKVTFQNVDYDFKIYSRYRPQYPSPWAEQQDNLKSEIHGNYLGWNGEWFLDFQTPIYTWIHRRLDLGWLL